MVHSGLCCGKGRKRGKGGPQQPQRGNVIQRMVGNDVQTNPYTAGADQPGDCSQLSCNLDASQSCCWTNNQPPADQLNWVVGSGQGEPQKLQNSFGTQTSPSGNYFITASETAGTDSQTAQLYSCPINCANNDITVKLKHWQSQGTKIQVCSEKDPAGPPANCQDLPAVSGQADTVTIPKDQNVRIVIQAKGFTAPDGTVAMVDDIEVQCDPCASTTTTSPTAGPTPTAGPSPAPAGKPPCKDVTCDFESGSTCSYTPASGGGSASENWGVKKAPYQNRLTGIPKPASDGGTQFAGAYTKKKSEKTTLATNANFDSDYIVRYEYYKATEGVTFRACCNDESNCPKDSTPQVQTADYRAWKQETITCPAGTKSVLFVCENKDGVSEGACGLDNIQLAQAGGGDPLSAPSAC